MVSGARKSAEWRNGPRPKWRKDDRDESDSIYSSICYENKLLLISSGAFMTFKLSSANLFASIADLC